MGKVCCSVHKNALTVPAHIVGTGGMQACVLTMRDITAATPPQGTEQSLLGEGARTTDSLVGQRGLQCSPSSVSRGHRGGRGPQVSD